MAAIIMVVVTRRMSSDWMTNCVLDEPTGCCRGIRTILYNTDLPRPVYLFVSPGACFIISSRQVSFSQFETNFIADTSDNLLVFHHQLMEDLRLCVVLYKFQLRLIHPLLVLPNKSNYRKSYP